MPQTRSVFSAANATIEIAGREIGKIQSLTAQINYNLQEIKNLYADNIQSFPRGITTISINARRALVDSDGMFGNYDTISKLSAKMDEIASYIPDVTLPYGVGQLIRQSESGTTGFSDWAATGLQTLRLFGGMDTKISGPLAGIKKLQDLLIGIKSGAASIGDFFAKVPFDIIIKMQSDVPPDKTATIDSFFVKPFVLWKFENCIIGSRNFSIDINNIVIMEECTIACKKFIELPTTVGFSRAT